MFTSPFNDILKRFWRGDTGQPAELTPLQATSKEVFYTPDGHKYEVSILRYADCGKVRQTIKHNEWVVSEIYGNPDDLYAMLHASLDTLAKVYRPW